MHPPRIEVRILDYASSAVNNQSYEVIEEYHVGERTGDFIGGEFLYFCTLCWVIAIDSMDPSSPANTNANAAVDNYEGSADDTPFNEESGSQREDSPDTKSLGADHGRLSVAPIKAIAVVTHFNSPLPTCSPATHAADVPPSAGHIKK